MINFFVIVYCKNILEFVSTILMVRLMISIQANCFCCHVN